MAKSPTVHGNETLLFSSGELTRDNILHLHRSVNGKLCFGYEECNQFAEAEKTGAIALEHTPNDIWAIHAIAHIKEETLK